jgi:SAM-dependent methyltransferase
MTGNWDIRHQQGKYHWKEPEQSIIDLVPILKEKKLSKILDLGCGEGRHIIYLAQEGFQMYGLDISETAILKAKKWIWQEMQEAVLVDSDMIKIPYGNNFFDGIIAVNVIYHNCLADIQKTVGEVHRILRPLGLFYLTLNTREADGYGNGEMVEPYAYIHDSHKEDGIIHYYFDEKEARDLLSGFHILQFNRIDKNEFDDDFNTQHLSYWNILAEKVSKIG